MDNWPWHLTFDLGSQNISLSRLSPTLVPNMEALGPMVLPIKGCDSMTDGFVGNIYGYAVDFSFTWCIIRECPYLSSGCREVLGRKVVHCFPIKLYLKENLNTWNKILKKNLNSNTCTRRLTFLCMERIREAPVSFHNKTLVVCIIWLTETALLLVITKRVPHTETL